MRTGRSIEAKAAGKARRPGPKERAVLRAAAARSAEADASSEHSSPGYTPDGNESEDSEEAPECSAETGVSSGRLSPAYTLDGEDSEQVQVISQPPALITLLETHARPAQPGAARGNPMVVDLTTASRGDILALLSLSPPDAAPQQRVPAPARQTPLTEIQTRNLSGDSEAHRKRRQESLDTPRPSKHVRSSEDQVAASPSPVLSTVDPSSGSQDINDNVTPPLSDSLNSGTSSGRAASRSVINLPSAERTILVLVCSQLDNHVLFIDPYPSADVIYAAWKEVAASRSPMQAEVSKAAFTLVNQHVQSTRSHLGTAAHNVINR